MPVGSSRSQREEGKRCSPTKATARASAIPFDGDGCALRRGSVLVGEQGAVPKHLWSLSTDPRSCSNSSSIGGTAIVLGSHPATKEDQHLH